MPIKNLNPDNLNQDEDWLGNNVAFTCPLCRKVFIVSHFLIESPNVERGVRKCPGCGKSTGHIKKDRKSGGSAWIEY